MFRLRLLAPAAFAALAMCGSLAQAATFDININGQSPQLLIDAINTANSNGEADTINLSGFVNYTQADNTTYGPTGFPVIKNDGALTINGVGGAPFIGRINNVNNPRVRIFAMGPGARLTINNLRFANGAAGPAAGGAPESSSNHGGAIYNGNGGSLSLSNCDFDGNTATTGGAIFSGQGATLKVAGGAFSFNKAIAAGGAIYAEAGAITVEDARFASNSAPGDTSNPNAVGGDGGAICVRSLYGAGLSYTPATLHLGNCDFGDNSARLGGAVRAGGGSIATIARCAFFSNRALFGGGFYNEAATTVDDSSFFNNRAEVDGGALATQTGFLGSEAGLTLRNCTIGLNQASGRGGAVRSIGPLVTLESCTLTRNSAATGGGISYVTFAGRRVRVRNCVISGNTGQDLTPSSDGPPSDDTRQVIESGGYNLIGSSANTTSFQGPGDRTGINDPGLETRLRTPRWRSHFAPQAGSPVIDQGKSALPTDQLGKLRPNDIAGIINAAGGDGSDIGAIEFDLAQPVSDTVGLAVNTVSDIDDGVCGVQHCSLREAINGVNSNQRSPSISFDARVFGAARQIITLGGDQLPAINTGIDLMITAPAVGLIVDGAGKSKVFTVSGRAVLRGLTIRNGDAAQDFDRVGGGIYVTGTATLFDCTLTGNSSPFDGGAAAVNETGTLNLIQCTLAGNSARAGSAVSNFRGRVTINNCTLISDDTVTSTDNVSSSSTRTTISNSLIVGRSAVGNNGANGSSSYQSGGYNIITGGVAIRAFSAAGDRTDLEPTEVGVGTLAENGGATPTIRLLAGSPALNGGDPTLNSESATGGRFDQRGEGFERIVASRIDIGAFEAQSNLPSVTVTLAPNAPKTNDVLTATAVGTSPTNGSLSYSYQWTRNGTTIEGETERILQLAKAGNGDKGDAIAVIVRASDSEGTSAPARAQVTVINSVPVAISSQGSVDVDTEKGFPLLGFDADGDKLTYIRVGGPRNGVLADIRLGDDGITRLFYRSRPRYGGVDIIRFVVRDSEGRLSNESTLGISVNYTPPPPVNRAPVAGDTNIDTFVGKSEIKGLLGRDPDGDAITFRIVNNAKFGKSEIKRDTDGLFKLFYTSLPKFYGPDRVTYIVIDSYGKQSNLATVNINFINRSPVAQPNKLTVASGEPISQFVFADDPDNDAVSFRLVNNPQYGSGAVRRDEFGNWRVYYQSVLGYVGPDRITFIAIDPQGKESQVATAEITVVRVGSTPSAAQAAAVQEPSGGGS